MKKLSIIILVFFLFVYLGSLEHNREIISYRYEENKFTYVFVESKNKELIGVKMIKKSPDLNGEIKEIFNYLTKNNSCLPIGYKNHMVLSTTLENYEYNDKELKLYLSEDFLRINGNYALKQIYYSYLLLGFEQIFLYINEEKLEYISDIYVYEGIPFFLANPVYDNYEKIVNIYYNIETDYIKPVSYLIPKDKCIEEYINVS